jgi:sulfane dehydrogenase subunit SoxC
MTRVGPAREPDPGDESADFSLQELQLATRNHGMPLEGLRYPITPVGLHYLLIHYDIPFVDPATWRLQFEGRVRRPLSLSLDELRSRPAVTRAVTFECAGNGRARLRPRPVSQPWLFEAVGTGEWTGVPLRPLLEEAGLLEDAVEVVFRGLDRGVEAGVEQTYERSLAAAEARGDDILLAYELNGVSLPPQHGFPLRLVVPGWYGMTNVKWLHSITAVAEPFLGYQQASSYRVKQAADDTGQPLSRMAPRALMVPPGIPEFPARSRFLPLEPCRLEGRAWSGWAEIERVEVSTDGGASWSPATLGDQPDARTWRSWSFPWEPPDAGRYVLGARCRDAAGNAQPADPAWNLGGYANNAVQWVEVTVTEP